ncbi:MAG: hypothetical protein FWC73_10655 [Defluviitaleaceae bacterium]|nr:hypothetical protein [Defluviitaleaceae bacterium]
MVKKVKNEGFHNFKIMLFMYLALSKVFYWVTNIQTMGLYGFDNLGQMIMNRLLTRDLFLILCVILSFYIYKIVKNQLLAFGIFYVLVLGLSLVQMMILDNIFDLGYGSIFGDMTPFQYFVQFTMSFILIGVFFTGKEYMTRVKKKTEAQAYAAEDTNTVACFSNALICETCKTDLQDRLNLFGQFVGEWEFEGVYKKGTPEENRTKGEWIFSWILDGTAIQDVYIHPSREEQKNNPRDYDEYSTTLRFYNLATDSWDMYYGGAGKTQTLVGRQVGKEIIVSFDSESEIASRAVFSDIKPGSFCWRSEKSRDGGVTWEVPFELMACRK